jgi:hypothetical protein
MSCNRENVTWQSESGSWSRGFFEFYDVGSDRDDWDYEWDVEYDHGSFCWVSTGHASAEAANESWRGSNPGGSCAVAYSPETKVQCDRYDEMASKLKQGRARNAHDEAWGFVG